MMHYSNNLNVMVPDLQDMMVYSDRAKFSLGDGGTIAEKGVTLYDLEDDDVYGPVPD